MSEITDHKKVPSKDLFFDLFDFEEIRQVQKHFSIVLGVASVILTPDREVIADLNNFSKFCLDIVKSGLIDIDQNQDVKSNTRFFSLNGLLFGAAGIVVDNVHVADFVIGQVCDDSIPPGNFIKYFEEIDFGNESDRKELLSLKRISREKFESSCAFLQLIVNMLSAMAVKSLDQTKEYCILKETESLLAKEKDLYEVTLHSISDAVITTDLDGRVTSLNRSAENLTGWTASEAQGEQLRNVFHVVNKRTRKRLSSPISRILRHNCVLTLSDNSLKTVDTILIKKDSSEIRIVHNGAPIKDENGNVYGVVIVFHDVSDETKKDQKLLFMSYHDNLTGLYNRAYFEKAIVKFSTLKHLPVSVIVGDVNGLKMANDTFGHDEGDRLLKRVAEFFKAACRKDDVIARWGGDEFLVIMPNTSHEEAKNVISEIRRLCALDVSCRIKPSIALGTSTRIKVSEKIKEIIQVAEQKMYRNKLLETSSGRSSTISTLQSSLLEKNHTTEQQSARLIKWSTDIAQRLGMKEDDINDLKISAVLHDIGKIAIPDEILNKPEKLTDEEWKEMVKHTEIGYRIANSTSELAPVAEYILSHHERWDGSGYPNGKMGNEIPLISRIIAVADAYDAMINDRPYKEKMTKEEAAKELRGCAGKQFDPRIVDIFIDVLEESRNQTIST